MESFTITVCLKAFFDDFRAKSLVFVDITSMKKVKHVVHHIKTVFGISSDAYLFSQDYFVPGAEDCRILKTLASIRLEPLSSSSEQLYNECGNYANHEQEDSISVLTKNNQDEIQNIDRDEHLNSRQSSKKKKLKRKQADSDNHYNECGNYANHEQEDSISVLTKDNQDNIQNIDKDEHLNSRQSSKKKKLKRKQADSDNHHNECGNYANHEQEDSISVLTKDNQDDIQNIDKDEHLNSKKKKLKRKRADSDNHYNEYSSSQPDMSDNVSSITCNVISVEAGEVDKTAKRNSSKIKDTPNRSFYGKSCELAFENNQVMRENSPKENGLTRLLDNSNGGENGSSLNMSTVDKTLTDPMASNSNTNTDDVGFVPKRKRIRKRKKAAKAKDIPQDTETNVPQVNRQTPFQTSKLLTRNPKHIYFSEAEHEGIKTQAKLSEVENTPEEESLLLNCPDDVQGEVFKQEVHNQPSVSENASEGQKINSQPSVSVDCHEEGNSINQSIPSEDPANSGTAIVQTATEEGKTPRKSHLTKVYTGLGKLLSLVRHDSPPVFERKKFIRTGQTPKKSPKSPVLPPAAKSSSSSQNYENLTPLKVMPALCTIICFKILKMSPSYCPELSNSIVAVVKEVNQETHELLLKIISGAEECKQPNGKFDLDEEPVDEVVDEIKLKWESLIQPCTCN